MIAEPPLVCCPIHSTIVAACLQRPTNGLSPPVDRYGTIKLPDMRRDYVNWHSPSLNRNMELLAYGDRGFPFVVFPTSGGTFYEYEDRGMVHALSPRIEAGELQLFCVDSVDRSSWYDRGLHPADRL